MVRPGFKERYILPETIHVGDTVRASWVRRDVRASAIGKVASIVADGPTRTFYTEGGEPIFTYVPGSRTPTGGKPIRITLLDPALSRMDATLPGLDFENVG